MNATLAAQIITYLVQYGPVAIQVIEGLLGAVKQLLAKGKPTPAEIQALALGIEATHAALPRPVG